MLQAGISSPSSAIEVHAAVISAETNWRSLQRLTRQLISPFLKLLRVMICCRKLNLTSPGSPYRVPMSSPIRIFGEPISRSEAIKSASNPAVYLLFTCFKMAARAAFNARAFELSVFATGSGEMKLQLATNSLACRSRIKSASRYSTGRLPLSGSHVPSTSL